MNSTSPNRSSKEAVLRRVKQAIDAPQSALWGREDRRQQELQQIPREFRTVGALSSAERVALFRSRLDHYGAASHLATGAEEVRRIVQELLRSQKKETVLVAQDVQEDWIPRDIHLVRDSDLSY
jgi:L-lactate utilization protein LutB